MDLKLSVSSGREIIGNPVRGSVNSLFSRHQSINDNPSNDVAKSKQLSDQAAQVALSGSYRNDGSSTEKAARSISDVASYISIAQQATSSINDLLEQAENLATQATKTTNANELTDLTAELQQVLGEIEEVGNSATFNGSSVINAGALHASYNLTPEEDNSSATFLLTVENIGLSLSDLGIEDQGSIDLATDAAAVISTLQDAQVVVSGVNTNLNESVNQLQVVAQSYGLSTSAEEQAIADDSLEPPLQQAESLTNKIVNEISQTLSINTLNPLRVQDLLTAPEQNEKAKLNSDTEEKSKSLLDDEPAAELASSLTD